MKHHNREEYVDVDKLSQPQLIMQHFRNFDLDKNGYIDGLEILKAAIRMNGNYNNLALKKYQSLFIIAYMQDRRLLFKLLIVPTLIIFVIFFRGTS